MTTIALKMISELILLIAIAFSVGWCTLIFLRQKNRQTSNRQTNKATDRQTNEQTNRQTDSSKHTGRLLFYGQSSNCEMQLLVTFNS
jgi:hypothetical protein